MKDLLPRSVVRIFTMLVLQLGAFTAIAQETAVFQWANSIGSTGAESLGDITIDTDGNVYTFGGFSGTADFDPGPGVYEIVTPDGALYVTKTDANGNFVWARAFRHQAVAGFGTAIAIDVDASGNVYTTGEYFGTMDFDPGTPEFLMTSAANDDVFMCKLDSDGNLVWAKTLEGIGSDEQPKDIEVDATGAIYISGSYRGFIDFDPGPGTFNLPIPANNVGTFYGKYDTNGNLVWVKEIHYPVPPGYTGWPGGESLILDASGNIYSTGTFRATMDFDPGAGVFNMTAVTSANNEGDAYILKMDNTGAFVWAKRFGSNSDESVNSIALHGSNLYITGRYGGAVVDFDPGAAVVNLSGDQDYVSSFDLNGNFIWAKSFGGFFQMLPSVITDGTGNVYVISAFTGTAIDFDPGPGVFNLTATSYDVYVLKLESDGDFVYAVSYGGIDFDVPSATVLDNFGNLYTHGSYGKTVDFDPSSCVYNLTSVGNFDAFTMKLQQVSAILAPTITSFSPSTGPIGGTVTITGANFSTTPSANVVKFFNNKTATVTASTATSLTVTVPVGTVTGKISVTVNCMTATSATDFTIGAAAIPTITGFTPSSGPVGTSVTINGTNFSTTPANNIVKLNGTTATVSAATSTSLTLTVPANATSGKFTVTVGGNTATSSNNFIVTVPSGNPTNDPPQIAEASTTASSDGMATLALGPLLSDDDDNIDLTTLHISSDPISGAPAFIDEFNVLTINYSGITFTGTDRISIEVCDVEGECTERELTIEVSGELSVFNAISPNGDGKNEVFYLQSVDAIQATRNNKVTVYNRWGDVVFETTNYNNTTNAFRGVSKNGNDLPSGNYFYKIEFEGAEKLTGFIAIKR